MLFEPLDFKNPDPQDRIGLADLAVLAVDCQASGHPAHGGRLLEIGWAPARAFAPLTARDIETHLIKRSPATSLPPQVQRITGLREADLASGSPPRRVWKSLVQSAERITALNGGTTCPAVAHFARYEEAHLKRFHAEQDGRSIFPLEFVCTHRISRKLLPELPRKSIRAVAGYFGCSLHMERRSGNHVLATSHIWSHLVHLLERREGIRTLSELAAWLERRAPVMRPVTGGRTFPMAENQRRGLPDAPGVYRFIRSNGDPLYIGKANSLKRRVGSYFQPKRALPDAHIEMLTQARFLDVTETATTLEAALLESDEIKRLAPPYNRALRTGERTPVFCTPDLKSLILSPGGRSLLGPFPSEPNLRPLLLLARAAGGERTVAGSRRSRAELLGTPEAYAPGPGVLKRGLEDFNAKYGRILEGRPFRLAVFDLGKMLWLEHRRSMEAEADPSENGDVIVPEQRRRWDPERVIRVLEGQILRIAHLHRRARWLCLLSESSLAWSNADGRSAPGRMLILSRGRILQRADHLPGNELPVPPDHSRLFRERQSCFDLETYDRLRVLTTEIRRILGEGRPFDIRLAPRRSLDAAAIGKALLWL